MDLLRKVHNLTGRLEEYIKGGIDLKLREIVVKILTTLLEIFARSEKLIHRGRIGKHGFYIPLTTLVL